MINKINVQVYTKTASQTKWPSLHFKLSQIITNFDTFWPTTLEYIQLLNTSIISQISLFYIQ